MSWYNYGYESADAKLYWERCSTRARRVKTARRDWSHFGGSVDQAIGRESGGTFVPAESGNRGEVGVMASTAFTPEVAEEEDRLNRGDRLHRFIDPEEIPAG